MELFVTGISIIAFYVRICHARFIYKIDVSLDLPNLQIIKENTLASPGY